MVRRVRPIRVRYRSRSGCRQPMAAAQRRWRGRRRGRGAGVGAGVGVGVAAGRCGRRASAPESGVACRRGRCSRPWRWRGVGVGGGVSRRCRRWRGDRAAGAAGRRTCRGWRRWPVGGRVAPGSTGVAVGLVTGHWPPERRGSAPAAASRLVRSRRPWPGRRQPWEARCVGPRAGEGWMATAMAGPISARSSGDAVEVTDPVPPPIGRANERHRR